MPLGPLFFSREPMRDFKNVSDETLECLKKTSAEDVRKMLSFLFEVAITFYSLSRREMCVAGEEFVVVVRRAAKNNNRA